MPRASRRASKASGSQPIFPPCNCGPETIRAFRLPFIITDCPRNERRCPSPICPADWKAEIDGDGKPVSAAFVDYDGKANLTLKLTIPAAAKPGPYRLLLKAGGEEGSSDLPIAIQLAPPLAAKLTATPKLPVLKGRRALPSISR